MASHHQKTSGQPSQTGPSTTYKDAPTRTVDIGGTSFAYQELGTKAGVPVIFLNHLTGVLDNWDPRVVDGIAARHRVITFDNRGVGASQGSTPDRVEAMARDAVAFIQALGFEQVDLLGFSLGGFIAQVIAQQEPHLVRKIILAGTGPAGGEGIDQLTSVFIRDVIKSVLTFKDPKSSLFFTTTANGKGAARTFLQRSAEPSDLTGIEQPVLVVNGDNDKMIPSSNSTDLAQRLPHAQLILYPDAGHGGIFQYHEAFVPAALTFLES